MKRLLSKAPSMHEPHFFLSLCAETGEEREALEKVLKILKPFVPDIDFREFDHDFDAKERNESLKFRLTPNFKLERLFKVLQSYDYGYKLTSRRTRKIND